MKNNQLIKLLSALSPEELRGFSRFVRSPNGCVGQSPLKLINILKKYYPDFSSAAFQKEKVFRRLYPGQPFNNNLLRKACSRLKQLLENYLIDLEIQRDTFLRKKLLTRVYRQRNLHHFFDKGVKQLDSILQAGPGRGMDYHLEMFLLNKEVYFHPDTETFSRQVASLDRLMEHLDRFIMLSKLCFSSEMLSRKAYLNDNKEVLLLEEILREVGRLQDGDGVSIYHLYVNLIRLQEKGSENLPTLRLTEELFKEVIEMMSEEERDLIYKNLINYAISKYHAGRQKYGELVFRLYEIAIQHNLILHRGYISVAAYTNVAVVGSIQKQFDWTWAFIHEYDQYLRSDERDNAKNLSLAYWYFHQNMFERSVEYLQQVNFSVPSYGPRTRTLLLRNFYELYRRNPSQYDHLMDQIDAFRRYMQRDQLLSRQKSAIYLNFIHFLPKLINADLLEK